MPGKRDTAWDIAWQHLQDLNVDWPSDSYISSSELKAWSERHGPLENRTRLSELAKLVPARHRDSYIDLVRHFSDPAAAALAQNAGFIREQLAKEAAYFDSIEAYPLTDRQRLAVVTNEDVNLVVAGAGTGKTSTIIARIDYLVRNRIAAPHEILVLAFGNDAAAELNQRIAGLNHGSQVRASTFHALGLRILSDVEGRRPPLTELSGKNGSLQLFVYRELHKLLKHGQYWRLFDSLARLTGVKEREHLVEPVRTSSARRGEMHTPLTKTMAECVSLFKGQDRDMLELLGKAKNSQDKVFLNILELVLARYQAELDSSGTIDFNDMVNRAREYVREGRWQSPYRHIIIDEFQDIAHSTFDLVQALRQQVPHSRLFAVGDDWQAIYGFNGGDVSIMTGLEKAEPAVARIDLDVAFRYPQELLDITSAFAMKNPQQLKKTLTAQRGKNMVRPVCVIYTPEERKSSGWDTVLERIVKQTDGAYATVFALGRYTFNVPKSAATITKDFAAKNLHLKFMTAHRSKGLEADYVVIPDVSAGEYGFPSNLEDHEVLTLLRTAADAFPQAEERRLFYVALTRARERVFLLAPAENASPFISEDLLKSGTKKLVTVVGKPEELPTCPECHHKSIRKRQGRNGTFWGCSRFPNCRGALPNCPECEAGGLYQKQSGGKFHCTGCSRTYPVCQTCHHGAVTVMEGKYGIFEKCTNYRNH